MMRVFGAWRLALLLEEPAREFCALDAEMQSDIGEDRCKCAGAELSVIRDGHMMLARCCVVRRM
jgi:hypothetical protein